MKFDDVSFHEIFSSQDKWIYISVFFWATHYVVCMVGAAYTGEVVLKETNRMKELIGKHIITDIRK